MTGWMFLAFAISIATALTGGICIGAQWVRDDVAAQQRFAAELEQRRAQRNTAATLPLTYQPSTHDQRQGLKVIRGGQR